MIELAWVNVAAQKITSLSSAVDVAPSFSVAGKPLEIASLCSAVVAGSGSEDPDFDWTHEYNACSVAPVSCTSPDSIAAYSASGVSNGFLRATRNSAFSRACP